MTTYKHIVAKPWFESKERETKQTCILHASTEGA